MKIKIKDFRVSHDETVDLKKRLTLVEPIYESKRHYKELLENHVAQLSAQQEKLFAENSYALLIIFQAMDAAGKDGAIKHVMSGVNPQGCQVFSFSHPSAQELQHDFLWRATRDLPERGKIGIFNRSYYEEVLIVRVQPDILRAEALPEDGVKNDKIWHERYRSIVDFESHMHRNGTRIIKIFLHMSKSEQKKRLLERIDNQEKNWKIQPSDLQARQHWKFYRQAYEECLSATSTRDAPWHVVPADDKPSARLIVSQIILEAFDGLDLQFPKTTPAREVELAAMRKQLDSE